MAVSLVGPDGNDVGTVDTPTGRRGPEVLLLPAAPATYRVEVRSPAGVPAGRFAIRLEELETATAAGRDRLAAEEQMAAAERLRRGGAEKRRAAAAVAPERHRRGWSGRGV